jgi:hypothetical protein
MHSFNDSLVHRFPWSAFSLIDSLIDSLILEFPNWYVESWYSFRNLVVDWFFHKFTSFIDLLIASLIDWFPHSLIGSWIHSLAHSFIDLFNQWFVHRFFHVIDFIIGILTTNCSFADAHHNLNLSFLFNPKRIPIGHCSHGSFSKSPHWHGRALSGMAKIQLWQLWHSKCM